MKKSVALAARPARFDYDGYIVRFISHLIYSAIKYQNRDTNLLKTVQNSVVSCLGCFGG